MILDETSASFTVVGHHRSYALAERHRKELERKYGFAEIVARRNNRGRYSTRGTNFEFIVEETREEYVVHFDYGSKKENNLIQFQVHITGPKGKKDREIIEAIREIDRGKIVEGYRVKAITWSHPPARHKNKTDGTTARVQPSAIAGGAAQVVSGKTATR